MQKRIIKAKMSKLSDADIFNIAFWKKMSPQKKFAAAWELTQELFNWNHIYGRQQRLRRSIACFKPRKS